MEWRLPPDYIINNWTEELLNLMIEKMIQRKKRESEAISEAVKAKTAEPTSHLVSDTELFALAGIKVVKQ